MCDVNIIVMTAFISPFIADRKIARDVHEKANIPFFEVYINCESLNGIQVVKMTPLTTPLLPLAQAHSMSPRNVTPRVCTRKPEQVRSRASRALILHTSPLRTQRSRSIPQSVVSPMQRIWSSVSSKRKRLSPRNKLSLNFGIETQQYSRNTSNQLQSFMVIDPHQV